MNLYLEYLTIPSFLFIFHNGYLNGISQNGKHIIYYIDTSRIGKICGQLFGKIIKIEFQQLRFKMMDIKDDNGEERDSRSVTGQNRWKSEGVRYQH